MVMKLNNGDYAFACLIDAVKEASRGNLVVSGCEVSDQDPDAMAVDVASGLVSINGVNVVVVGGEVVVDASDSVNDRFDLICVGSDGTVDYVAGTAGVNPYPPDLPADHVLLAVLFVENNSSVIEASDVSDERIIEERVSAPIGSVVAWLKSFTNTPSLPFGWVECNGQTLSDVNSVYNGQTIPDLNGSSGTERFLRGQTTSGGTGGSETHTHDYSDTTANNTSNTSTLAYAGGGAGTSAATTGHNHAYSGTTDAANTLPSYYEVVWIMRVK